MKIIYNKKGFTLIELVLYIGISSIILLALVNVAWSILHIHTKQGVQIVTSDDGFSGINLISYYAKRAKTINLATTYGNTYDILSLDYGGDDPNIVFDVYNQDIVLGSATTTIKTLRLTKDGISTDITGNEVTVDLFKIYNYSSLNSTAIYIEIAFSHVNPEQDQIYEAKDYWTTTINFREK